VWTKFNLDVNLAIEKAHKDKQKTVEVSDRHGTKYCVDLQHMMEYVTTNTSKKWKVERRDIGSSSKTSREFLCQ